MRKEKYEDVLKSLPNVTFIEGRAKFISPTEIEVNKQRYQGKKFIIATGSTAHVPTISEAIKIAALSFTTDITKLSCCV